MSFADNLVYLRQHYGITQEGLAEQLSVSRQTVSKWKAGKETYENTDRICFCQRQNCSRHFQERSSLKKSVPY